MPQSTRTRAPADSTRYRDPVTVRAAPRKVNVDAMRFGLYQIGRNGPGGGRRAPSPIG